MGKKKSGGVRVKQIGPKNAPQIPSGMLNPMEALQIPQDEMVHLPPPPDRSYQIFWPIHETFSMDPKADGFQVIYPSYLDKTKTVKQGRRIPRDVAVDKPTVADMSQALQLLQVRHVLQPYKGYSRDITCQWDNPGRLLVDVKAAAQLMVPDDDDGCKSQNNKMRLMRAMVAEIPKLPERISRLEREAQERAKYEEDRQQYLENEAKQNQQQKKTSPSSTSPSKKKGKKGNKRK